MDQDSEIDKSEYVSQLHVFVYLVTYSHICFTRVMAMVEIYSFAMILQCQAMETLEAAGSNLAFTCYIFLWSASHVLQ